MEERYRRLKMIVEKEIEGVSPAHDVKHVTRVYNQCLRLASYERSVDLDVLKTSALLHDIARSKEDGKGHSSAHACSEIGLKWFLFVFHGLRAAVGFAFVPDFSKQLSSFHWQKLSKKELWPFLTILGTRMRAWNYNHTGKQKRHSAVD